PTHGIRRGGIINMDEVSSTITTALERAAHLTNQRLAGAYFSITGTHIDSCNHSGAIAITPADRDIDIGDVRRVIDVAGAIPLDPNRLIMAITPRTYTVDSQDSIKNPLGMSGHRLEVESHIVTGASSAHRNLLRCAERARIMVEDVIVAPLASAEAVLAPGEREVGTVLIDIGGGTSDIAIFAEGGIWRTLMMPLGGRLITDDVAYALRLPTPVAEALKITYGSAIPERIDPEERIELEQFLPNCQEVVKRRDLAKVIQPRIEEILIFIRDEVRRSGRERIFAGGVVLTGGTAELVGITEMAAQVFNAPVRIGAPHSLYGMTDAIVKPTYATAIGLLRWHEQAASSGMYDT
ncbi:MAG TPA: cell division protein FtsA, partial [Ktedonobacterales bacterium]|nr:cell division protein FtsA [Ktedonobacterales bacterium]